MRWLLNTTLLLLTIAVRGQSDSLPPAKKIPSIVRYIYEQDFVFGKPVTYSPDTILAEVDKIQPSLDGHYNFLATTGSAAQSQIYSPNHRLYTFTGPQTFEAFLHHENHIRYFKTNKRFSEINYHTSAFKEQSISFFHTQQIFKNWNTGLIFDRMGVKEFMNFSDTYRSRFALFTWYHTKDGRYNLFAHAYWNSIKNDVNGGLESDSLFENTAITNLGIKGLAYRISYAGHRMRKRSLHLGQYFDVGRIDTDSTGKITGRGLSIRLHHSIKLERRTYAYSDLTPDSSFYDHFYYGTETYDSLHSDEMINRFTLQVPSDSMATGKFLRNWSPGVFAELQNVKYGQRTDTAWNNFSIGANVLLRSDSVSAGFFAEANYVMSGSEKENYRISARLSSARYRFGQFFIHLATGQTSPDYSYSSYDSNNFRWSVRLAPGTYTTLGASYSLPVHKLKVEYIHDVIDGYVYLNQSALPDRFNDQIVVDRLTLIKNFTYRNLHFDNTICFQHSDNDVLRVPDVVGDQSVYIERYYYKKALKAATGIRANYNTSYYADAFMPSNAMFYLQDEVKTGGYVRFDIFINIQIKTASIFLRVENVLDDVTDRSYFLTPHYPMPGRVLKFGVRWRFFD